MNTRKEWSAGLAALAVAFVIGLAGSAEADSGSWTNDGSGNWSDTTKWAGGAVADGAGFTAWFTNNITAGRTVTVDTARVIGFLNVGDPVATVYAFNFVPASGGTLTFDNSGATAQFNQTATAVAQTFGVPVVLASPLAIANNAVNGLTITNGITGTGNLTLNVGGAGGITLSTLPVNNSGTITISGTGAGAVTISGGVGSNVTAIVQNNTSSTPTISTLPLLVNAGGTLLVNSGKKLFTVSGNVGGTGDLVVSNNATDIANAFTISGTVSNYGMVVNSSGSSTGTVTISAAISNTVTKVIQNSTNSALKLQGASTFTNGLWIKAGKVVAETSANSLGLNTNFNIITLGDTDPTSTANATLVWGVAGTYRQTVMVSSGNTGIATIEFTQNSYFLNGPFMLDSHDLTFVNSCGIAANAININGGITGIGNLTLKYNGIAGIGFGLYAQPANHRGTIINAGTGNGMVTIDGGVGTNVTAIIQNSINSPLTVSSSNLTVNINGTTLANISSGGTNVLKVSCPVVGTGDLILSNNCPITNGITISSTAVTNIGRVINSGTGSGDVLVSGVIGPGVTGVRQESATSRLVLGGANTCTGLTEVVSGKLRLDGSVSNVTVGSGAILQGNGRVRNTVTINNGGTVSPGLDTAAGGTLTNGTLVWNSGGIYTCQVANLSGVAGVDYDQIIVTGSMTAASGVIISMDSLGQTLAFNTNLSYSLKVITCGTAAGLVPADVTLDTTAFLLSNSGTWLVTNRNKSIYVYYQPANASINYWINSTGSGKWTNDANWSLGHVPQLGEDVVFDSLHSVSNCTVDTANANLGSLTLDATYAGSTVTVATVYPGKGDFTDFSMTNCTINGGVLTHPANTGGETNRLSMTVRGNLYIGSGATISALGCGYAAGQGPGGSTTDGGAYGGMAAGGNTKVYGSIVAPTNLGSGGRDVAGGGAIYLTVGGTTTVASAGVLDARATASASDYNGSGGSVFLTTGWLTGTGGTIRANGGPRGQPTGASYAGGGGRVAIVLTGANADFTSWGGTNQAFGGACAEVNAVNGAGNAAAGTVYRRTAAGVDELIIDNNNGGTTAALGLVPYGNISTLMPDGVNLHSFSNVIIRNYGVLGIKGDTTVNFGTFAPTVYGATNSYISINTDTNVTYPADWTISNYTLFPNSVDTNKLTNITVAANSAISCIFTSSVGIRLSIPGNLTVNGSIDADGRGYMGTNGPGGSSQAGGAYGGGAFYAVANGTNQNTYGSIISPTDRGSGSGGNHGGGVINLTVAGTTTVSSAGMISANGFGPGWNARGSGGSVKLRTGWLAGSGTIRANGANSTGVGGSGGGGRVAIVLTTGGFSTWTGTNTAYAGASSAAAGTVYRQEAGVADGAGTVIVDNGTLATNLTFTSLPAYLNKTEDLRLTSWVTTNKVRLGLTTNCAIASLNLSTTNCTLVLNGWTLTTSALTVTNKVYKSGEYTPADISLLTDSVGGGKVVVTGAGTVIMIK